MMTRTALDLLAVSPCSEREIEVFTTGDCWKLAYELHSRGLGQVVGVTDSKSSDGWCHMAVELKDGLFLDARGIQTRDQLLGTWAEWVFGEGEPVVARYNAADPTRWANLVGDQEPDYTTAKQVRRTANKLVKWARRVSR